jgi:hypothetical protein
MWSKGRDRPGHRGVPAVEATDGVEEGCVGTYAVAYHTLVMISRTAWRQRRSP